MSNAIITPAIQNKTHLEPCKECGGFQFMKNGGCRPCAKKQQSKKWNEVFGPAYRQANKEKIRLEKLEAHIKNKESVNKAQRDKRLADPEKYREQARNKYILNHEKIRKAQAGYYQIHKDARKIAQNAWRIKNIDRVKEIVRAATQNRRAAIRKIGGVLSANLAKELYKLQRGKCPCCNQPLGQSYHMDHKMPLKLGGSNTDDNMQLMRSTCNMSKGSKHPVDFMQSRGFLI